MGKYKLIPLSQGKFAKVDAGDFEWLGQFKWQYHKPKPSESRAYARTAIFKKGDKGKATFVYMHRMILQPERTKKVDHEDGDGLNNRRSNIRICTTSQNNTNTKIRSDNTSGYKGVFWHKGANKWGATIKTSTGAISLGLYETALEGATAYNIAARKHFGEFARLNDIEEVEDFVSRKRPEPRVKYKGVVYDGRKRKYRARIGVNGRRVCLGRFKTAVEAALAYDEASIKFFGRSRKLNIISEEV